MKKIINLTQHVASAEQKAEGVFEPEFKEELKGLLTFNSLEELRTASDRANKIVKLIKTHHSSVKFAMIGGHFLLMLALTIALKEAGITPLISFTKRVVKEKDGVKTSVFKHEGFVKVELDVQ